METSANTTATKKISISLTNEAADFVSEASRRKNISASEVIRRALAIQRFVDRELETGATIVVRRPDGSTERVQFIFT